MKKWHSNNVGTNKPAGKIRQIYHPPTLTVYGRVGKLTQANETGNNTDGVFICGENADAACLGS